MFFDVARIRSQNTVQAAAERRRAASEWRAGAAGIANKSRVTNPYQSKHTILATPTLFCITVITALRVSRRENKHRRKILQIDQARRYFVTRSASE